MKILAFSLFLALVLPCLLTTGLAANNSEITPSDIPITELEQFIDNYANECIGTTTAGASVVILKNGEVFFDKTYGYADADSGIKVDADAVFEWGSATKLLVWVSVMQLVEQGKLNLNTDIREYLPEGFLTKIKFDMPVTTFNLMHHNAGWEDRLTNLFYRSADDIASLEEELRVFEPNQVNEPGDVVAYSNYGTALAGYIVECISGQPFYEYVNENIFMILGMNDTAIHPTQEDNPSVAARRANICGYTIGAGDKLIRSKNQRIFIGLYPAGSAVGTSADAAKFLAALMPSKGESSPLFKNNDTLEEMLSTSYSYGDGFPGIAHGFWENFNAVRTLRHGGNTDSFSSCFAIAPEAGLALVVMTNQANEEALCYDLPNKLFGEYPVEYMGEMPDAHELAGSYITARRPYNGFSKLYGFLQVFNVKAVDNHSIEVMGYLYTQVHPYVFCNENDFLYFTVADGKVIRASMMYTDYLPLPGYIGILLFICIILAIVCVLYIITALLVIIIGGVRNKKKGMPSSLLKKMNMLINLAGAAVLINNVILVVKAFQYSSYMNLRIHFGVNVAYVVFTLISVGLMIAKQKEAEPSKGYKLFYICSGSVAVVFAVLVVAWELYR